MDGLLQRPVPIVVVTAEIYPMLHGALGWEDMERYL